MALPAEVTARVEKVIRRLSSAEEGEIVAPLPCTLALYGADVHTLAEQIENSGMSGKRKY